MKILINTLITVSERLKSPLYWVGGPVRDALLGRPFEDGDLVCRNARRLAGALARRLKARRIVLDEKFHIYRLILPPGLGLSMLDVAELHGRTIHTDLARRDFTINAMAAPLETFRFWEPESGFQKAVIDPFKGQADLRQGVLRAVSQKAFEDDPLRLLRAFRFAAQLGFAIEPRTAGWIRALTSKISRSSPERVRHELLLLLAGSEASRVLEDMDRGGLLTELFADLEACRRTAVSFYGRGGVLRHALESVKCFEWLVDHPLRTFEDSLGAYLHETMAGHPRLAHLKLAALLHDLGKPDTAQRLKGRLRFFEHEHVGAEKAYRALTRLRFSRQESLAGRAWVKHHMRLGNLAAARVVTDKALARYFRDLKSEAIGMILVSLADHYTYLARSRWGKGTDPVEKMAIRLLKTYFERPAVIAPVRLVDGHDLMKALKLSPGPEIGRLLNLIRDAQVEGKVTTREQALELAGKRAKRQ